MIWKKLGNLYEPAPLHPKLKSHAANPLPLHLEGNVFRVFYSGRDDLNRSSVGYVDIDLIERKVIYVHKEPLFVHGPDGSFFSHGISVGNYYQVDGQRYMLFMGWRIPENEHWRGEIGRLSLSENLQNLSMESREPFIGIDETDSISLSYPWVLKENGVYRMWYGSTLSWDGGNAEMIHVINSAQSENGHQWVKNGLAVPYAMGVAQAFSHPCVIHDSEGYHMWFSYRSGEFGQTYRIGYAHSNNGVDWELRLDKTGINVSSSGWDSEMLEYPYVVDFKGERYMFYNGNGYGESGFGLAIMERK